MSNTIYRISDSLAILDSEINAAAVDNTTQTSAYLSLATASKITWVVTVKDTNAADDTTIDVKVQSADDSSGTNVTDISGLATTQITADNAADQILIIEVDQTEVNSGDTHVRCVVTAGDGTAGANICITAIGGNLNYLPASEYDSAEVAEIKTL